LRGGEGRGRADREREFKVMCGKDRRRQVKRARLKIGL
jgi:hypothetical protein